MEKFKGYLSAAWQWLKGNWMILTLFVMMIALGFKGCERSQTYDALFEQYRQQTVDHQTQIEEITTLHREETEELNRQMQEYLQNMERIERQYKEEIVRITERTETRRVQIIRNHDSNPGTITSVITDTFGIPVEE